MNRYQQSFGTSCFCNLLINDAPACVSMILFFAFAEIALK